MDNNITIADLIITHVIFGSGYFMIFKKLLLRTYMYTFRDQRLSSGRLCLWGLEYFTTFKDKIWSLSLFWWFNFIVKVIYSRVVLRRSRTRVCTFPRVPCQQVSKYLGKNSLRNVQLKLMIRSILQSVRSEFSFTRSKNLEIYNNVIKCFFLIQLIFCKIHFLFIITSCD